MLQNWSFSCAKYISNRKKLWQNIFCYLEILHLNFSIEYRLIFGNVHKNGFVFWFTMHLHQWFGLAKFCPISVNWKTKPSSELPWIQISNSNALEFSCMTLKMSIFLAVLIHNDDHYTVEKFLISDAFHQSNWREISIKQWTKTGNSHRNY